MLSLIGEPIRKTLIKTSSNSRCRRACRTETLDQVLLNRRNSCFFRGMACALCLLVFPMPMPVVTTSHCLAQTNYFPSSKQDLTIEGVALGRPSQAVDVSRQATEHPNCRNGKGRSESSALFGSSGEPHAIAPWAVAVLAACAGALRAARSCGAVAGTSIKTASTPRAHIVNN